MERMKGLPQSDLNSGTNTSGCFMIRDRRTRPRIILAAALVMTTVLLANGSDATAKTSSLETPQALTKDDIPTLIAALPHPSIHIAGIAFLGDRLFVRTTIGLLEIQSGAVVRVYRWNLDYGALIGPWGDKAHHSLWLIDPEGANTLRFDGTKWFRHKFPQPLKGHLSRSDRYAGFHGVSNGHDFWLVGAGSAWKWQSETSLWVVEPIFTSKESPYFLRSALPLESGLILLASSARPWQGTFPGHPADVAYAFDGKWSRIENPDTRVFHVDEVPAPTQAGYICSKEREVLHITPKGIEKVDTPGLCEAIASTEESRPLISVKGQGVYERSEMKWTQVARDPYPETEGEHYVFLAEHNGVIAYATSSKRDLKYASTETGTVALWLSSGGAFRQVDLGFSPLAVRNYEGVFNVDVTGLPYFDPPARNRSELVYRRHGGGAIPRKFREKILLHEDKRYAADTLIVLVNRDFIAVRDALRGLIQTKMGIAEEDDNSTVPLLNDPEPQTVEEGHRTSWGQSWPLLGSGFSAFEGVHFVRPPREYRVMSRSYNELKSVQGRSELRIQAAEGKELFEKDVTVLQLRRRDYSREWARDAHVFGGAIAFPWKENEKFFLITSTEVGLMQKLRDLLPGSNFRYFIPEHREPYTKADPALLESMRTAAKDF